MPLGLPVVFEVTGHAGVGYFPLLYAVYPNLLDGWFCHLLSGDLRSPSPLPH